MPLKVYNYRTVHQNPTGIQASATKDLPSFSPLIPYILFTGYFMEWLNEENNDLVRALGSVRVLNCKRLKLYGKSSLIT